MVPNPPNSGYSDQDWASLPVGVQQALYKLYTGQDAPTPGAGAKAPKTVKIGGSTYQWDPNANNGQGDWVAVDVGTNGSTGSTAGAASAYHLDPRELALEYAKLNANLTDQQMSDLKDLLLGRNSESVNLANAYGNIADKAAAFAANPRDAVADLMYRQATSGQQATPFGSIDNSAFGGYGNALADKFQAMFGPTADALKRAGDYIGQIPPSEYLTPPTMSGIGTGGGGGGGGGAAPNVSSSGINPPLPPGIGSSIAPATNGTLDTGRGQLPAYGMGGRMNIGDPARFGGYQPSSSEGGTNMNIHEPAVIVGMHSGHPYAMIAENGYPEQVKITPTAAGKAAAQQAAKSQNGIKKMGTGGDITFGQDPAQFMDQLRKMFSLRGINTTGTNALPDPRLFAGDAGTQILNDPMLKAYTQAGYSALGVDPNEFDYSVSRFQPAGLRPELPKVSF